MSKFYAAAYGTYNASDSGIPWEDDIREFCFELELEAENLCEAECNASDEFDTMDELQELCEEWGCTYTVEVWEA